MSLELAFPPPSEDSFFRRLRFTPLRDVLRGRLSGRLDVEGAIAASPIPHALKEIVRATVRGARLWRLERADLARELIAHFEDGLAAGTPASDLLCSFGDAKQAAQLIRRAKLRNRPAVWRFLRFMLRATVVFIALLALIYGVLAWRVYSAHPVLSRNILAELNQPTLSVPADERAWPLYREAALKLGTWPDIGDTTEGSPHDPHWDEWRAFVERHRDVLRMIAEAARRPQLGAVYSVRPDFDLKAREDGNKPGLPPMPPNPAWDDPNPHAISIQLPQLHVFREFARLVAMDARIAIETREGQRVFDDLETVLRVSEHCSQMPFLISDLVAFALIDKSCGLIGEVLRDAPELLTDRQIVDLCHRLAALRGGGVFRTKLENERVFFADVLQRMYTDDGSGDGRLVGSYVELMRNTYADFGVVPASGSVTFDQLVLPVHSALVAGRRETHALYDELMNQTEAEAAQPLWKRGASQVDRRFEEMQKSTGFALRYPLLALLFPMLSRASASAEISTLGRDGVLVALALELEHRRSGAWPKSLADLTPQYLPSVPPDRADGQPIRYRVVDGRPLLYSIGGDLDDDGGRVPSEIGVNGGNALARRFTAEIVAQGGGSQLPDGDWVLWPPPVERK